MALKTSCSCSRSGKLDQQHMFFLEEQTLLPKVRQVLDLIINSVDWPQHCKTAGVSKVLGWMPTIPSKLWSWTSIDLNIHLCFGDIINWLSLFKLCWAWSTELKSMVIISNQPPPSMANFPLPAQSSRFLSFDPENFIAEVRQVKHCRDWTEPIGGLHKPRGVELE